MKRISHLFIATLSLLAFSPLMAGDVWMTPERETLLVPHQGQLIKIERNQDTENILTGGFAKTSRKCPPFCITPMEAMPGVETYAEVELFDFMDSKLSTGAGVLIDARVESWFQRGTIPGSTNLPFTLFEKEHTDLILIQAMEKLGVKPATADGGGLANLFSNELVNDKWDFTDAKEIVLWCNGPWCDQSPHAIRALVNKHGYPAERIKYYRGGMQMWQVFGLTTVVP